MYIEILHLQNDEIIYFRVNINTHMLAKVSEWMYKLYTQDSM